jgi:hypothetical protein
MRGMDQPAEAMRLVGEELPLVNGSISPDLKTKATPYRLGARDPLAMIDHVIALYEDGLALTHHLVKLLVQIHTLLLCSHLQNFRI